MAIRLRFSTEKYSVLSALIRWRTECKISHVEFETDDGWTLGARFSILGKLGRHFNIYRWSKLDGVQYRSPAANRKQSHVVFASFPGIDLAYNWVVKNRLGCPYDVEGILGIATASGEASQKDEFCSRVITDGILNTSNWFPLHLASQAVTPRDLAALFSI